MNPGLEINGRAVDYRDGQYGPDIVSDYLCDFIQRHREGPFFAYYPMILTHWPFEPTPDSPDYDKTAPGSNGIGKAKYFPDMVAYADKMVGKIVDKLDSLGIRQNTLLLFTGDNGTYPGITSMLGDRPYPGGKGSTRDNGTHVPLIASWPGTAPRGVVSDALVDFSDMLPTLAEVGGADVPAQLGVDGLSFAPLLQGRPQAGRPWVYCWYQRDGKRGKESQHTRDRRYKLYANGRFYDTVDDFTESHPIGRADLSADVQPVYTALKTALDAKLLVTEEATRRMAERAKAEQSEKKANKAMEKKQKQKNVQ